MTKKRSVVTPGSAASGAADDVTPLPVSEDAVVEFLYLNPELLSRHPRLLEAIVLPSRSKGSVVDIQHVLLQRLREENDKLRRAYDNVVGTARYNRSAQRQVHAGVLQILSATSFERLIHTVTTDLPLVLDVDAITICLEAGDTPIPRAFAAALRCLPKGTVERLLGAESDIVLCSDIEADETIFGPAAGLVHSQALARLCINERAPKGLLALGARDAKAFRQNHSTELIGFLTQALEVTIRRWLNLPT